MVRSNKESWLESFRGGAGGGVGFVIVDIDIVLLEEFDSRSFYKVPLI